MSALLQARHWFALAEAAGAVRALPATGDVLLELLRIVERAIPASLARFSAIDPATFETFGVNTHVISSGGEDLDLVAPEVLAGCPFLEVSLRPDAPAVVRLTDAVGARAFWGTQSWEVYYRPAASRYTMSARLSPPGVAPVVAIDLDRETSDFTTEEVLLFDLLRPHLREGYERVCAIERGRRAPVRETATAGVTGPTEGTGAAGGASFRFDRWHQPLDVRGWRGVGQPASDFRLPATMAETLWLHYGSFSRDDRAAGWDLTRTVQGEAGPVEFRMTWDAAAGNTCVARAPVRAGAAVNPEAPAGASAWRPLLALGLTPREAEVLFWVAEGKANDVIGRLLGLSPRTVQKHVENLHRKLGVEGRTAAAGVALRHLLAGHP